MVKTNIGIIFVISKDRINIISVDYQIINIIFFQKMVRKGEYFKIQEYIHKNKS